MVIEQKQNLGREQTVASENIDTDEFVEDKAERADRAAAKIEEPKFDEEAYIAELRNERVIED